MPCSLFNITATLLGCTLPCPPNIPGHSNGIAHRQPETPTVAGSPGNCGYAPNSDEDIYEKEGIGLMWKESVSPSCQNKDLTKSLLCISSLISASSPLCDGLLGEAEARQMPSFSIPCSCAAKRISIKILLLSPSAQQRPRRILL